MRRKTSSMSDDSAFLRWESERSMITYAKKLLPRDSFKLRTHFNL